MTASGGLRCPVLVGRDDEVALLRRVVQDAAAARPAAIAVLGPAGVGKTRLVAAAIGDGGDLPHAPVVAVCRCRPEERSRSLHALREALLVATRGRSWPEDDGLAAFAGALDRLVPGRSTVAAGAPAAMPPAVVGEAAFRLLRALADEQPVVLVVEDLHWADEETLGALAHLVAHLERARLAVVLTARPAEPGASPGVAAVLAACDRTVELGGLGPAEVATMAAACRGTDEVPAELLDRLLASADGLPLLVEDLTGAADGRHPRRFSAAVLDRLATLDEDDRRVVETAALAGRVDEPRLLAVAAGTTPDAVDGAVRAAVNAQLLVVDGSGATSFRHMLTAEVIAAALPPDRRRVVAGALAGALEAAEGDGSARAGALWGVAREAGRAEAAFRGAATTSARSGALGTAAELYERALAVGGPSVAGLLGLAEVLIGAGRFGEAVAPATTALDLVATAEEGRAVRFTLADAHLGRGDGAAARHHLDALHGLALDPREDARLRVLEARSALAADRDERARVAAHLAAQAVGVAERVGAVDIACEALELVSLCRRDRSLAGAIEPLDRMLALAQANGLGHWRVRALNELGAVEALRDAVPDRLVRARAAADELGLPGTAASIEVNLAALHVMTGEVDATLAATAAAIDLARPLDMVPLEAAATMLEGLALGYRGDRALMEARLDAAEALAPDDPDLAALAWAAGRGIVALLHEDGAGARHALERADRHGAPARTLDPARGPLLLVRAAGGDDPDEVARLVDEALAVGAPDARYPRFWLTAASAVLAGTAGAGDEAARRFAEAEALGRPYRLFRAVAFRQVAAAALRDGWGAPADWLRDAEAEFVARSLTVAASGCRGLLRRAGERTTRRRGADAAVPAELLRLGVTAREAEVLDQLAAHLTNPEIAERLHLSVRTVEKHVASLLAKTGAANRRELARRRARS